MAYRQGFEVASRCLGLRHPLTLVLADNSGADVGTDLRVAIALPGIKPVPGHAFATDVKVSGCTVTRDFIAGPQLGEYALPPMKPWPPQA